MAEERRELQEAGYATLGQAMAGHVMISVVIAPLVVGVLWLLGLIMQPGTDFGALVVLGLVTTSPFSSCSGPLACGHSRGNGATARPRCAPSGKPRKR